MTKPRSHPRAPGRAEDHADAGPEGAVARPVRQRAAAVQPPLPGEPAGLPHPGTRLWRAEAGDDPAAGAAGRGTGRRRQQEEPHPRSTATAHRRHAADARMAGRRARRHRHRRRLRMAGAALQVAVRHRPRHHRHALERLGVLRAEEPQGADMTKPPEKSKVAASCAARSTPANPPRKGWSRSSTRCTPSARPARPTSPASGPRAGCWSAISMTTAASPAARWTAPACSGCWRTSRTGWSTWSWSTRSTASAARWPTSPSWSRCSTATA
jgi:hypothetical protein